jgi:hypothetical protein
MFPTGGSCAIVEQTLTPMRLLLLFLLATAALARDPEGGDAVALSAEVERLYRQVYWKLKGFENYRLDRDASFETLYRETRAEAVEVLQEIRRRAPHWRQDIVAHGLKLLTKPAGGEGEAEQLIAVDGGKVLRVAIETWSLGQEDFLAVLGAATESQYRRVAALAEADRARLVNLMALTTKSGQRAVVEAHDEVRHPTEWNPPWAEGELAFPTAAETRNAGETLEVELVLGPDEQTIDVNLVPQVVRFLGFRAWRPEPRAGPHWIADFSTARLQTACMVRDGAPHLLGTLTLPPLPGAPAGEAVLAFLRVDVIGVPLPDPARRPGGEDAPVNLRAELAVFSLERGVAARLLAEPRHDGALHAAVTALVKTGAARVEHALPLTMKSGQRAVAEQIVEVHYPGEVSPPGMVRPPAQEEAQGAKERRRPAQFTAFETRHSGLTLEIEPVFSPEMLVDVNVVPQWVVYRGTLDDGEATRQQPPLPLFSTQKITTSTTAPAGGYAFLGTMSPPRDSGANGRKDDGRTWLAFLHPIVAPP